MFAKRDDNVVPTVDGIASLQAMGVVTPDDADQMRALAMLREKLPEGFSAMRWHRGADHPWVTVAAMWDGQPIDGDVSAALREAVAPLEVRDPNFFDGQFYWAVEAPTAETWAKQSSRKRALPAPVENDPA